MKEKCYDEFEKPSWMLENLYLIFRVLPYEASLIRAVKKEKKLYFWDWSTVENTPARFENMVACHLLKYCHFIEDTEGYEMELRFLRDTDLREIDFLVLKGRKPLFAVECKTGEKALSSRIQYFQTRLKIPEVYQVHTGIKEYGNAQQGGMVIPFEKFCRLKELV